MGKYLKYAFGEVILVVLGILIALSINNWNDRRVFKNKVFSQLKTLSKELGDDIGSFEDITFKLPSKIHYLKQLSKGNYEGLDLSRFLYNVAASGRVVSYGEAYKILINNGGIDIIENDKLRNNLAVYNDRIRPLINETIAYKSKAALSYMDEMVLTQLEYDSTNQLVEANTIKVIKEKKLNTLINHQLSSLTSHLEVLKVTIGFAEKVKDDLDNYLKQVK